MTAASTVSRRDLVEEHVNELLRDLFLSGRAHSILPQEMASVESALSDKGLDLVGALGRGGSGFVFKAWDNPNARFLAVKILKPELWDDLESRRRFVREAGTVGELRHPSIVQVLSHGVAAGAPYIAMENVEGCSLDRMIRRHGMRNHTLAMRIIQQVAEGLAYVSRQGVIHCDIKPHNILLTREGTAKICDFGSCKRIDQDSPLTGFARGTKSYASPELLMGDRRLDWRTDVFSLGAAAYQLLTGKPPIKMKSASTKFVPPTRVNPAVAYEISEIIMHMIEPDRRLRPEPATVAGWIGRILSSEQCGAHSQISDPFAGAGIEALHSASRAA